ncbi:permease protein, partial [Klebsiella pneumoniae subsp. pneumoniae KPNIH23]
PSVRDPGPVLRSGRNGNGTYYLLSVPGPVVGPVSGSGPVPGFPGFSLPSRGRGGASLWPIILGACLTGVGGALFSPSIEALLARAGTHSQANGKRSR